MRRGATFTAIALLGLAIAAIMRASSKVGDNFDCQLADCGCGPWGYCADCQLADVFNSFHNGGDTDERA